MSCQKRALALSHYVKARIHLVYAGFQQSSRDNIKTYQIFFQKMTCDLAPQGNFLYVFFQCALPEETVDMEIMVQTLAGIHNYRKDHTMERSYVHLMGFMTQTLPINEEEDERLYGGETEHYKSVLANPKMSQ